MVYTGILCCWSTWKDILRTSGEEEDGLVSVAPSIMTLLFMGSFLKYTCKIPSYNLVAVIPYFETLNNIIYIYINIHTYTPIRVEYSCSMMIVPGETTKVELLCTIVNPVAIVAVHQTMSKREDLTLALAANRTQNVKKISWIFMGRD